MEGSDKPTEWNLFDDIMNTFVGSIRGRTVMEEEKNTSHNLDEEEKEAEPAEQVPEGVLMSRYKLRS